MLQSTEDLLHLAGLVIWGDFADFTLYTCKGRVIMFAKTRPEKAPSELQLEQRARFTAGRDAWIDLTQDRRDAWETATTRLSLPMHGYNLWLHWKLTGDTSAIETIEHQTGLDLIP